LRTQKTKKPNLDEGWSLYGNEGNLGQLPTEFVVDEPRGSIALSQILQTTQEKERMKG
jgi:hypothetical protein